VVKDHDSKDGGVDMHYVAVLHENMQKVLVYQILMAMSSWRVECELMMVLHKKLVKRVALNKK
jgi:hypothetical protein